MAAPKGFFAKLLLRDAWSSRLALRVGWFDDLLVGPAAAPGIDARVSWVQLEIPAAPAGSSGTLKYWTGAAWVAKPLKRWNGSAWVAATLKRWNGSAWV